MRKTYQIPLKYCPTANKPIYPTSKEARTRLNQSRNDRGKEGAVRYYQCEHCKGYHLTGDRMEIEEIKATKKYGYVPKKVWKGNTNLKHLDKWQELINKES